MLSFNLFGIPIRILPWFWVTMALIGGGIGANDSLSILLVLVFILAGLISILVHELGHALTVRKFGLPTAITLQAFGGYASFPAGKLSRKQSFLVTAAGPALQLTLGISLLIIRKFVPVPPESLLNALFYDLIAISIIWAILNCLPVYPMDGGQMMAAVLGPKRAHFVHLISAIAAVTIGVASYFYLNSFLLPIFMAMFAWQNWQSFQARTSNP
ncbi:MAG: stage IV sporulation protein FB [Lentimonas sp.]|jgi:stage IV sporulation protein FB